jgi:hypothetical protein
MSKKKKEEKESKVSILKQKITAKKIMKKGQMTAKMPAYVPENIWAHKNLFFQGEMNNEKRSLYFS